MTRNLGRFLATFAVGALTGLWGASAARADDIYLKSNLVGDIQGVAPTPDSQLVNPWGIANVPGGPFWINDNGTGLSTLYDGTGAKIPATFTIPAPAAAPAGTISAPTGMIWNPTSKFLVPGTTLPALFIFDTEDGTISAWAPGLPTNPSKAVLAVDNSTETPSAVYKGLAFGTNSTGNYIYATNFRSGNVDVFDSKFHPATLRGSFTDPNLPSGYAPFGIANISGNLWVTYAVQDSQQHDDVAGPGNGIVDIFDTNGFLIRRFHSHGMLNSPWGIVRAPEGFGRASNTIIVGNFGDGTMNYFNEDGSLIDPVVDAHHKPIVIPGLWSLVFGGASNSNPTKLFFTAGPDHEQHGLFGAIIAAQGDNK